MLAPSTYKKIPNDPQKIVLFVSKSELKEAEEATYGTM